MRFPALLCLLALLAVPLSAEPPCGKGNMKNGPCSIVRPVQVVPVAGSVLVISTVTLLGAPDTARISVTGPTAKTRKITASVVDTTVYPMPAAGVTINGVVSVAAYKGGSALPVASMPWTFTGAGATLEVIVKPISSTISPGGSLLYCTWYRNPVTGAKLRSIAWPAACEPLFTAAS